MCEVGGKGPAHRHSRTHFPSSGVTGEEAEEGKDTQPPSGQLGLSEAISLPETAVDGQRHSACYVAVRESGRRGSQALDLRGAVCQGRSGQASALPPPSGLPLHTENWLA